MTPDGVHFSFLFLGEGKNGQTNMGWVKGFRCVVYLRPNTKEIVKACSLPIAGTAECDFFAAQHAVITRQVCAVLMRQMCNVSIPNEAVLTTQLTKR